MRWTWSCGHVELVGVLHDPRAGADDGRARAAARRCRRRRTRAGGSPPCCTGARAPPASRRGRGGWARRPPPGAATFSDHGPVAFTTRSAWISASRSVTWSWTATPLTTPVRAQHPRDLHVVQEFARRWPSRWRRTASASAWRPSWRRAPARRPSAPGSAAAHAPAPRAGVRTLRRDPRGLAAGQELRQVVHVLVVDGDEQAVVLLEGPRRDPCAGSCSPRCTPPPTPGRSRRSAPRCGAGRDGGRWCPT